MAELKPCPFCKCQLIKHHTHYENYKGNVIDYDYWKHPYNECFLAYRMCDQDVLMELEVEAWNRRAEDGK